MSTVIGQEDKISTIIEDAKRYSEIKDALQYGSPELRVEREEMPNVGTPGHIDYGSQTTKPLNGISEFAPEDIEYTMDDWKKSQPAMWYSDQAKLGGKKRNKAKWKAQKKARKANRK